MKKILIALCLLPAALVSAQDSLSTQSTVKETYATTTTTYSSTEVNGRQFKPFKVGLGLGYAVPTEGDGAGGGVLFFVEPAYRASDVFSIGLRLEAAVIVRGVAGVNTNNDIKGDASTIASYTLNGQYYFSNNTVRPFIGIGGGLFSLAAGEFNTAANNNNLTANRVDAKTVFGFYPRAGVDAGHFTLSLDYNFLPKSNVPGGGEVINSYLGIRAGLTLGGGKYQK